MLSYPRLNRIIIWMNQEFFVTANLHLHCNNLIKNHFPLLQSMDSQCQIHVRINLDFRIKRILGV